MGKSSKDKKSVMHNVPDIINSIDIQINGDRQVTVNGCKGIAEYSDFDIKIKTSRGLISVGGRRLNIRLLSIDSVIIEGKILNVEFIDWR